MSSGSQALSSIRMSGPSADLVILARVTTGQGHREQIQPTEDPHMINGCVPVRVSSIGQPLSEKSTPEETSPPLETAYLASGGDHE